MRDIASVGVGGGSLEFELVRNHIYTEHYAYL